MKLNVDLTQLWENVNRMGAKHVSIDVGDVWDDSDIEFDIELGSSGVDISLDELESEEGLLSVRGRQVILFIPDHGSKVEEALFNGSKGNKFHVSDCRTLDVMKKQDRFERYKVTNNMSGQFEIHGESAFGALIEGKAELNVCKNCINKLNYKGVVNSSPIEKDKLVKQFNIEEFFATYSSIFKRLPKQHIKEIKKGYSEDWSKISSTTRESVNYICQHCYVDLSSNKRLLHVHHKNGEKSDNSIGNLIALCADCHRKEPYHGHMLVKHADTQKINALRNEQGVYTGRDWHSIKKKADPSLAGVINYCIKSNYPVPEVAYTLNGEGKNDSLTLELAWPKMKLGVALNKNTLVNGWRTLSLEEALNFFKKVRKPHKHPHF